MHRYILLALAMIAMAVPAGAGPPTGAGAASVVYQVSYINGLLREMAAAPASRDNIAWVTRIERFESRSPTYEILSSGPQSVTTVHEGTTARTQLVWNGTAWVEPPAPHPHDPAWASTLAERTPPPRHAGEDAAPGPPAPRPVAPTASSSPVRAEILRLETILVHLGERLARLDHAVAQGERDLEAAETDAGKGEIGQRIEEAKRSRATVLEAIRAYQTQRNALGESRGPVRTPEPPVPGPATVTPAPGVSLLPILPEPGTFHDAADLPHRRYGTRLPPVEGERSYAISTQGSVSTHCGPFRGAAYTDRDGDGLPDGIVATDPAVHSATPGGWATWYFQSQIVPQAWGAVAPAGLPPGVNVSGFVGGPPAAGRFWPYIHDLYVPLR